MNNYDDYDDFHHEQLLQPSTDEPLLTEASPQVDVDFDDPVVAALPHILLMGPRRGGKTSIQVCC